MRGGESKLTISLAALLAACGIGAAVYSVVTRQGEESDVPSAPAEAVTLSRPGAAADGITGLAGGEEEPVDRNPGPPVGNTWIGFNPPEDVLVYLKALAEQGIFSGTETHSAIKAAEAWAAYDPAEAVQWALGLPEHLQLSALSSIFTQWVRTDPAAAFDSLMKSENEDLIYSFFPGVVTLWSDRDPPAALEAIRQYLPGDEDMPQWTSSLLGIWAQSDAVSASSELDRLYAAADSEDSRNELAYAYKDVAAEYSQFSLDSARAWIETIDSPEAQRKAVEGLMPHWLRFQPKEATNWIKRQSNPSIKDPAIVGLINYTGSSDPRTAFQWAGEIGDPEMRSEFVIYTGARWLAIDPDTAGEYLTNQAVLTESERAEIFENPDLEE